MPRLTDKTYLEYRGALVNLWDRGHIGWAELEPHEQWELHDFFKPSEALTDWDALEHRRLITKQSLSLPARAGKAYVRITGFQPTHRQAPTPSRFERRQGKRPRRTAKEFVVRVRPLVRAQPDWNKLARAALTTAKEIAEREDAAKK